MLEGDKNVCGDKHGMIRLHMPQSNQDFQKR